MNSNSLSSASVASTFALWMCAARETNTTRAASPPFATRMLFKPAPANVALSAIHSDDAPTGRRKIHQRTPLSASDNRFTTAARNNTVRFASVMLCHVVAQLTLRANNTSAAMIATLRTKRTMREAAFFTRYSRGVEEIEAIALRDQAIHDHRHC